MTSSGNVPMTRRWYLGISNIRGNLYGCIDFAGFLGHDIEPAAPGASNSATATAAASVARRP